MRRIIRFLLGGFVAYLLLGFVILPPAIHGLAAWLAPRFLSAPLEIAAVYFNPLTLQVSIRGLVFGDPLNPVGGFEKLSVNLAWDSVISGHLHVQSVTLDAPRIDALLDKEGQLNLLGLLKPMPESSNKVDVEPDNVTDDTKPFAITIDDIRVVDGLFGFADDQMTGRDGKPLSVTLSGFNLDISSLGLPASTADVSLNTTIGEQGAISIKGSIILPQGDVSAKVDVASVDLTTLQPLLDQLTWLHLDQGRLSTRLSVARNSEIGVTATGQLGIDSLRLDDVRTEKPVVSWNTLNLVGMDFSEKDGFFSIKELLLSGPDVRVAIDRNMQVNLAQLMIETQDQAPAEPEGDSAENQPFIVDIGKIRIADGRMDFSDHSFRPGFATEVVNLQGDITDISTSGKSDATVAIRGQVDRYAPVRISGHLNPLQPEANTDIGLSFHNVELTTLTPYSGRFAGYAIRKGRMNLDLNYRIQERQLKATNKLVLDQLQLGNTVDSDEAPDLPLRLAIALLKDRNGKIDVDLPIQGDLDNPEFAYWGAVGKALMNMVINIAAAPFNALASLVGGDAEQMEKVAFVPGDILLSPDQQKMLGTLGTALNERPELMLEVSGGADRLADWPLLQSQQLETTLKRLWLMQQVAQGETTVDTLEQVLVPVDERPALLREYGQQLQIADIDNVSDDALQSMVLSAIPYDEMAMHQLAQQRARSIKDFLVDQAKVSAERVYLLSAVIGEQGGDKVVSSMSLGAL